MRDPNQIMSHPDEAVNEEEWERLWEESERDHQALVEMQKERYRKQGIDPENVNYDWIIEEEREGH